MADETNEKTNDETDAPKRVEDAATLEGLYRRPSKVAATKSRDLIDEASARFIANCPFVVLATGNADGSQDASPRGGPPGFVRCLDDRHVAIPDLNGNNRLDSHRNIVTNGHAGLLFLVPARGETLRINGRAFLTTDGDVLAGFTEELRTPKLAIVVRTDELFLHCAKAVQRSGLWEQSSWDRLANAPDGAEIYATQFDDGSGNLTGAMRARLDETYERDLALD